MKDQLADYEEPNIELLKQVISLGFQRGRRRTWWDIKQWLWEKHKMLIIPAERKRKPTDTKYYYWDCYKIGNCDTSFDSPITAEIEGIKKAVEYLHSQLKK